MTFIREFNIYAKAAEFAKKTNGKVVAQYDWDNLTKSMIKRWVVKY